jgi:hypothetical protein
MGRGAVGVGPRNPFRAEFAARRGEPVG